MSVIESGASRVTTTDPFPHDEYPEPAPAAMPLPEPRPRRPSTLGALVQIALCSGIPTQLAVLYVLVALGVKPPSTAKDWSLSYVAIVLLSDSALVVTLLLTFLAWSGERAREVFLGTRSIAREWVFGLGLVPIAFLIIGVINAIVQAYAPKLHLPENPFQPLVSTRQGIVIFTTLSILVGGLREEMQRAFALHRFAQIGIPYLGLIIFSVFFGLGHYVQGADAAIMTGSLGALWGFVYLRRRSLVAPAVCHGAFDAIQVIAFGLLRR
jgi:membrane protease YdiL (CAAX protease family)